MSDAPHDPIKNPRPEDLSTFGVNDALIWFVVLLGIALVAYMFFG